MKKSYWIAIGILVICTIVAGIICGFLSRKKTKNIHLPGGIVLEMQSISNGLWFGKYEVTQAQWDAVMGEKPSKFKNPDCPVEVVSWHNCQTFLEELNTLPAVIESGLNFRLPTGDEWEHACRANSKGYYCKLANGTEITHETLGDVAWFKDNSSGELHPVGRKKPNAFGLYDMHGNVAEWTLSKLGKCHIIRGGSWDDSAKNCESSEGRIIWSSEECNGLGFRICASLSNPAIIEELCASMVQIPGKNYKIGKCEVTQAQWEEVMGENPAKFKGADNPVENVSWDDCEDFLHKFNSLPAVKNSGLTFRLPTEKEWEYACRAGSTSIGKDDYEQTCLRLALPPGEPIGDYCKLADGTEITAETLGEVAWFDEDIFRGSTHPVGLKKPNAFGLYDMHGNVGEWTSSKDGENRVYRGGSFADRDWDCSSSYKREALFYMEYSTLGFRLCAESTTARECLSNRRQIGTAVNNWLVERLVEHAAERLRNTEIDARKESSDWITENLAMESSDWIKMLLDKGNFRKEPKCPSGGVYSIVVDSDLEAQVKCSIPDHSAE